MNKQAAILALSLILVPAAQGSLVSVIVSGEVVFNGIGDPPLSGVRGGDSVEMSFTVDSGDFLDGVDNTRGYVIDQSSFSMEFDSPVTVGLMNPFPDGQTPYFTLADGLPVSDGFWVSTSVNSPGGVPLEQAPFNANLELGYTGGTLDSLDILDAVGVYDFDGLTRFGFTIWRIFPDNVQMEIDFSQMAIVPEPSTALLLAPLALLVIRRRR